MDITSALLGCIDQPDPAWRAGGTTLQGHSTQQFMPAEPIKVDPTMKVELVLRLVARYYRIMIRVCELRNLSNVG